MVRILIVIGACLALSSPCRAQGQIHIAVGDCGGSPFIANSCTSNTGVIVLMVSAISPVDVPQLLNAEGYIVAGQSGPLSDWWRFDAAGCHAGRLTESVDFSSGLFLCSDPWQGLGVGALSINYPYYAPAVPKGTPQPPNWAPLNSISFDVVCGLANSTSISAGQEYDLFELLIHKTQTVGGCAGCTTPTELILYSVILAQPSGVGDITLYGDGNGQTICYNGGCTPTPACRTSWGLVKSLYR